MYCAWESGRPCGAALPWLRHRGATPQSAVVRCGPAVDCANPLVVVIAANDMANPVPAWVDQLPYRVVIVPNRVSEGTGASHSSWSTTQHLDFLANEYEMLPAKLAFLQGHQSADGSSWHSRAVAPLLRDVDTNRRSYTPLNTWQLVSLPPTDFTLLARVFNHSHSGLELPCTRSCLAAPCCSQFVVSAAAVWLRSQAFYSRLADYSARARLGWGEFSWHAIFGEPWVLPLPDAQQLAALCGDARPSASDVARRETARGKGKAGVFWSLCATNRTVPLAQELAARPPYRSAEECAPCRRDS